MASTRKISLLVTSVDEWYGYWMCRSILQSPMRHQLGSVYGGAMDESRPYVTHIKELGGTTFGYDPCDLKTLAKYARKSDAALLIPVHVGDEKGDSMEARPQNLVYWEALLSAIVDCQVPSVHMASILQAQHGQGRLMKELVCMETMFQAMMRVDPAHQAAIHRASLSFDHLLMLQRRVQLDRTLPLPIGQGRFTPVVMVEVADAIITVIQRYHQTAGTSLRKSNKTDAKVPASSSELCGTTSLSKLPVVGTISPATSKGRVVLHEWTGGEHLDGHQLALALSQAVGSHIPFQPVALSEFEDLLHQAGELNSEEIECFIEVYRMIEQSQMDKVSSDLQHMLGRAPLTARKYFATHRDQFRPSV
ncbi:hypothetical protein H4R35_000244 [Dimargaris xerosporica]|nr:hypothetical protein H4R35_000244 [Dimargaris xerosporica]